MNITWHGNASIALESEGTRLLFDPFVPLPGAATPTRPEVFHGFPNILITHGHLDHLLNTPALAKNGAVVYCTKTPRITLINAGTDASRIVPVAPGGTLSFGPVRVIALKGKHAKFDPPLVLRTLLSPRMLKYPENRALIRKTHPHFLEKGETLIFKIETEEKTILLLGSMALPPGIVTKDYARPDVLILPYQGHTNNLKYAIEMMRELSPRTVLLDHFDDAFPPASRNVDLTPFLAAMKEQRPGIKVIVPKAGEPIRF
ncbi:MAG: MBL fold metallo-hydrolase [Clostridiales Family XIII bacterium]|jgi:L-ascorbate metabolism protein UlaG (beta-lactamase superfamily)|nr:MBL fold metallo-hydrolase [Clostridiales Family XIII bacterium]